MSINLQICSIIGGELRHGEGCTCTIADIEDWYEDKLTLKAEFINE